VSILVLGTVALDTVTTPSGKRSAILGGSAVHFSMAARLFDRVHMVAVVGDDFPARHIVFLRRKRLDVASLARVPGSTFRWEGEYRDDLNKAVTIETGLGVLAGFQPRITHAQRSIPYVFLANVDPDIQRGLSRQFMRPRLVGLDSMNYYITTKPDSLVRAIQNVDIFFANDQEARQLSGKQNLYAAARWLSARGPRIIVIKKGEHGVFLFSRKFCAALPGYPVERVVDPTGAGDSFAGGFMGFMARSGRFDAAALRAALASATVIASFNVEGFGVEKTSNLTMRMVGARLKKYRAFIRF
jgi:sugar/nucleoside kinase (ribokinase family)